MDIRKIAPDLSVSPQILPGDIGSLAANGFRSLIINRPDNEASEQPSAAAIAEAAARHGLEVRYLPVVPGQVRDADVAAFAAAMRELPAPALAFCRTGTRSATLWALAQAGHLSSEAILATVKQAGYDLLGLRERIEARATQRPGRPERVPVPDVLIIGGGAGGLATAASLLKRRPGLDIVLIEPNAEHYYQPGWTLIGGGVFAREQTRRDMHACLPAGVKWRQVGAAGFDPEHNEVILEDGERLGYRALVVAPGLKLDWDAIPGLRDTLGKNGVTSNYHFDMAAYTWELVRSLKSGIALFTQPPMPIKCAGAPQKAMYLSCDAWRRAGVLSQMQVSFHTAAGVLFGVKEYVPALERYIESYGATVHLQENLVAVDGPAKRAIFEKRTEAGLERLERPFDMLHVCPPQRSHDFIRSSPLADASGWVEVSGETLQHVRYGNVFAVGDAGSMPNAKTAAAVRKQAPVAAHNILQVLAGHAPNAIYEGYGSCPITVERGKIVLAEFGYGGVLQPTFPTWFIDGAKPSRRAWFLKEKMLPWLYFELMLKGKEWLAAPKLLPHRPQAHQSEQALSERRSVERARS